MKTRMRHDLACRGATNKAEQTIRPPEGPRTGLVRSAFVVAYLLRDCVFVLCFRVIALRVFLRRFRARRVLRSFVVAFFCVRFLRAFCVAFLRVFCVKVFEGKRGAKRGKRPWVFSPLAIRADECGRSAHNSRFPSSRAELQ